MSMHRLANVAIALNPIIFIDLNEAYNYLSNIIAFEKMPDWRQWHTRAQRWQRQKCTLRGTKLQCTIAIQLKKTQHTFKSDRFVTYALFNTLLTHSFYMFFYSFVLSAFQIFWIDVKTFKIKQTKKNGWNAYCKEKNAHESLSL